jgi:DNA-binding NarL/FixJ family response regulator
VTRQEAESLSTTRVLICDDAPDHRAFVRAVLAEEPDLEVVGEASDGETCLTAIALTHPDVVILDLQMPVKDGFQVLDVLQRRPAPPRVLVVSAAPADEVAERVHAGGADFLAKGATPAELAAAVRRLT